MNWYVSTPVFNDRRGEWEVDMFYGANPDDYYDNVRRLSLGTEFETIPELEQEVETFLAQVIAINNQTDAQIIWLTAEGEPS